MKTREGITPVVALLLLLVLVTLLVALVYFTYPVLSAEPADPSATDDETTCVTYLLKTGGFRGGPQDCDEQEKNWCMDLNNDSRIDTGTECGAETLYEHFQGKSGAEGDT